MNKEKQFQVLKDLALSDAGKLLIQDIEANKSSTDTLLGHTNTNDMLISSGYVQGLDWVLGILKHYQTAVYEDMNVDYNES